MAVHDLSIDELKQSLKVREEALAYSDSCVARHLRDLRDAEKANQRSAALYYETKNELDRREREGTR